MRQDQFETLRSAASGKAEKPCVALIIDSPWLPGWAGISAMEYFVEPEKWLAANLQAVERFPDVIFVPGFWVEYGMAIEPSAFGCRVSWWKDSPASVSHAIDDISQVGKLEIPNPKVHGLMPFALHLQRWVQQQIEPLGYSIRMVAARGPLALATHLYGVTEFLTEIKIEPESSHKMLDLCTETVIRWLRAQAENLPDVEGILVLDDIPGLLSPTDYEEFAHPYLKRIFDAFPGMLKVHHNDAYIQPFADRIADLGVDILNFSHEFDIEDAYKRLGDRVTLMGSVPPLGVLARGTPAEVTEWANRCLDATNGRIILSAGGGTSGGTTSENIDALVEAVKAWERSHK